MILTNEILVNLIRVGWFVILLLIAVLYFAYRRSKIDDLATHIELEKVTLDEKYSQLDDGDMLKLSNDNNKLRPGSPEYIKPTKPKS